MRRPHFKIHAAMPVGMMIVAAVMAIGLGAIFFGKWRLSNLLMRAREAAAAKEYIQARLEEIKGVSYAQLCKASYLQTELLASGTGGDALRNWNATANALPEKGVTETIAIYALGNQMLKNAGTEVPLCAGILGSLPYPPGHPADATALSTPRSYISISTAPGGWNDYTFDTPLIAVKRTGFGSGATSAVTTPGDLGSNAMVPAQVRVDVRITWRGVDQLTRTRTSSIILVRCGSSP